ncbi:MAG: sporulation protein YqfD [Defluviitaleaceae bacterium]|nr:sporulation protein YqfD [Defluviitaleaceae bacterium]
MLLKIWYFLIGYVKIEIKGFSVERFISQSVKDGLILRDIKRDGGKFFAAMSLPVYKQAQIISQKTGTSLEVLRVGGLPRIASILKKRLFLVGGVVAFIAGLVFLTSFIWRVDISGTDRLDNSDIINFLEENGFGIGHSRRGVSYRDIENMLLLEFEDIAFVSLIIKGTAATFEIIETILPPDEIPFDQYVDIVSTKDAVVVYMAVGAGQPMFVPGDVVKAGEAIVTGTVAIGSAEEGNLSKMYVRADAQVWGRVYYAINFNIPLTYYEKSFTGDRVSVYNIAIGQSLWRLPFGRNMDFIYYETIENIGQLRLGQNYPMPFGHVTTRIYELERNLKSRSLEQAQHLAYEIITRRIDEEIGQDADILDKQISFTSGENALEVSVFLITIERIDQMQALVPLEPEQSLP